MKRHMLVVAGIGLAAIVAFSFVQVREGQAVPQDKPAHVAGPRGVGNPGWQRKGAPGQQRPQPGMRLHMLFRLALSKKALEDAETQRLLDTVLAARKVMWKAEGDRLDASAKLVKAVRSGDQDAIQKAKAELKQKSEALRDAAKKLGEAAKALGKRLKELFPDTDWKEGIRERRERFRGNRRPQRGRNEDVPPVIE